MTLSPASVAARRAGPTAFLIRPEPADVAAFSLESLHLVVLDQVDRALGLLDTGMPELLVVNLTRTADAIGRICAVAARSPWPVAVLVVCDAASSVPAALRAGCHGVLVRPLLRNLVAARVSRVLNRGDAAGAFAAAPRQAQHRRRCPACGADGAIGFDAVALRRWWFACLACDHVWIDRVGEVRGTARRAAARDAAADAAPVADPLH